MWILVVEAMAALGLLLFIAWWTLGSTQKREREALRDEAARLAAAARSATAPASGPGTDASSPTGGTPVATGVGSMPRGTGERGPQDPRR